MICLANSHNIRKDFKVSWRKITALKFNLRWDIIIKHLGICIALHRNFTPVVNLRFWWLDQELSTAKCIFLETHTTLCINLLGFLTSWELFLFYGVFGSLSCSGKLHFSFRGYTMPGGIEWNWCYNLMQLFLSVYNTVKLKHSEYGTVGMALQVQQIWCHNFLHIIC